MIAPSVFYWLPMATGVLKHAQDLVQKNLHGIEGYLGSLAFECIH